MKTSILSGLCVLTASLASLASASAQTVLIDFGSNGTFRGKTTSGNWNSTAFGFLSNLVDSTGAATTIDWAPDGLGGVDSFNGPGYTDQYATWDFGGNTTLQQAAIDATAANSDAVINKPALGDLGVGTATFDFYQSNNGSNNVGRFQIQQVTDGQLYDLTFFASKKFTGASNTETKFSVFSDASYSTLPGTSTLTHGDGGSNPNLSNVAVISNLAGPSNVNNIFYVQWEGVNTTTEGYINAMSITAVPEPSTALLLLGAGALGLFVARSRRRQL